MNANIEDLRHIRSMMERSAKFLSLSGISGVCAGCFALLGALSAYFILYRHLTLVGNLAIDLLIVAACVVILAFTSGIFFSYRKAKKTGSKFWTPVTFQLLKDGGVPLVIGGLFCLLLIYHHVSFMVISTMLIFYGLALIYVGARTFRDIKWLGVCEIVLGLIAGAFTDYALVIWAMGFGVLHIVYGVVMYFKYDAKSINNN